MIKNTPSPKGTGIAQDQFETVFKPFTRGEASRSAETGSHGLCLSISQSIIRAHGGTITLKNAPDETGLIVTVTLPNEEQLQASFTLAHRP